MKPRTPLEKILAEGAKTIEDYCIKFGLTTVEYNKICSQQLATRLLAQRFIPINE